ncbi:MAG: dTDP-4-dehydrorhamnose reductase [Caldilineaceae bacterium]|nr:dTDP-4-dehydrorhamnose reductase [Caldilineaceae bacterium]
MHILIVGGRGQLGQALQALYAGRAAHKLTIWNRPEHDLTDSGIAGHIAALRPDVVVNCAAWTDVDGAEANPAAAFAANADGPRSLAEGCARCAARLVHVSTNEVFAGEPGCFYAEDDLPQPHSVYARSKWAGEVAVCEALPTALIARTAWLFGPGGVNFPSKIIAAADQRGALRVVSDEYGNPTYAPDAAAAIAQLIDRGAKGIVHVVNEGYTSRFAFAEAVLALAGRCHIPLTPIAQHEWPRPAASPRHAVLLNHRAAQMGVKLRPWQQALVDYVVASQ